MQRAAPEPPEDGSFRWALEATTDCVVLLDREFRIAYVNRHTAALNGPGAEALVGRLHWEAWPQTAGTEIERQYRAALATGLPAEFEHHYPGDGVPEAWHEIHAYPSGDGLAVFFRDVTEARRQARFAETERERRRSETLASAEIASWVFEVQAGTVTGDPKLPTMFGLDPAGGPTYPIEALRERVHPDDVERIVASLEAVAVSRGAWTVEYRILVDGRVRWANSRGVPEFDESGEIVRIPGVAVDVTALKLAERRQRFCVELMDALRDLVDPREIGNVVCRMVGRFLGASRVTYGTIDVESRTVDVATGWDEAAPREGGLYSFEDLGLGVLAALVQGLPLSVPDAATHPLTQGHYAEKLAPLGIRAFLSVPLQRDGQLAAGFTVINRTPREWTEDDREVLEDAAQRAWDVAQRVRAEDELRALNAALDARVRERTEELQQANEELQSFASTISHDLRGPLRNIHGMGQMLLQDAGDRLTEDERDLLRRQAENAKRIAKIIEDLLGLARLSREPLQKAPFDLSALAVGVRDEFIDKEVCGRAPIEIPPGLRAVGDRRLVRFVLLNLLENACKFSPDGGTVRVGQGEDGAFFVSDEGVGFDMAYAAKIFQPFERLVSERQFPGTGIGLAHVHRIVARHGGRVWAESKPGEGATFRFTLGPPS